MQKNIQDYLKLIPENPDSFQSLPSVCGGLPGASSGNLYPGSGGAGGRSAGAERLSNMAPFSRHTKSQDSQHLSALLAFSLSHSGYRPAPGPTASVPPEEVSCGSPGPTGWVSAGCVSAGWVSAGCVAAGWVSAGCVAAGWVSAGCVSAG